MEKSSTDIRIDEVAGRVDRFEADVKGRFEKVDRRFDRFEDKVDARFDRLDARFDRLDARFDRWGKIVGGGVVTAVGTIVAGVIAKLLGV